ncbi:MAG: carbon-nitrogen hydrolase [Syntrophobacteraceae bacterium]
MNRLVIGLVQHSCTDSMDDNIRKSILGIRKASSEGAELIVLQELHSSLYFCQREDPGCFDSAESIPGPSTEVFGSLARELEVVIVASIFERRSAGIYHNTAVALEKDGSIAGMYRKMHIPDDPGYYEKYYFTPGDPGFHPIPTSVGRLGILVCWDQWFPEAARLMALAGAELLIYPTAIGWDPRDDADERMRQLDAWITIQRAHAIANGIPVVAVNRTGFEPEPENSGGGQLFWGNSFVVGPQGELLATASSDKEETIIAQVDKKKSEAVRQTWPFLRDRRIDSYHDLLKRYRDHK